MKNKMLIFSLCLLLNQNSSFAQSEAGHGGDGLLINSKPYLLDLVESGVEMNPQYKPNVLVVPIIKKVLNRSISQFPGVVNKIILKLSELHQIAPYVAITLAYNFEMYNFRLVNSVLLNVPDEDSVLDYDPKKLVQLAIRRGASIMIDKDLWSQLTEDNQAALLLHEMVYSLAVKNKDGKQISSFARALVGYLFTSDFVINGNQSTLRSLLMNNELAYLALLRSGSYKYVTRYDSELVFLSGHILMYSYYNSSIFDRIFAGDGINEFKINFNFNMSDQQLESICNAKNFKKWKKLYHFSFWEQGNYTLRFNGSSSYIKDRDGRFDSEGNDNCFSTLKYAVSKYDVRNMEALE